MSSPTNEKPGAPIITRPLPSQQPAADNTKLLSAAVNDGDSDQTLTPATSRNPQAEKNGSFSRDPSPSSAFYLHPTTRYSLEASRSESKNDVAIYETDLEANNPSNSKTNSLILPRTNKDCTIWPGQKAVKANHKLNRRKGDCNPIRDLDKRTKIAVKILIAFALIGLAVGIGVGVSKAVGGGVWKNNNSSSPINTKR